MVENTSSMYSIHTLVMKCYNYKLIAEYETPSNERSSTQHIMETRLKRDFVFGCFCDTQSEMMTEDVVLKRPEET